MTGSFFGKFDSIDDSEDWIIDDADDEHDVDADEFLQRTDDEHDDSKEGQT